MTNTAPTNCSPTLHPGPHLHQHLAALRTRAPVLHVNLHGHTPAWIVTRATEVEHALTDPRLSSSDRHLRHSPTGSSMKWSLMGVDGPEHRRLRRALAPHFTAARSNAMRPGIQHLTDTLLDELHHHTTVDLIQHLAHPLPLTTICNLLNVPTADRPHLHHLTHQLHHPQSNPHERHHTREHLRHYMHSLCSTSTPGLIQDLTNHNSLTTWDVADAATLLLSAGHETTTALIGSTLTHLLRRPALYRALRQTPSRAHHVILEVARLDGPVALGVTRYATTNLTIAGHTIPAGHRVLLSLGSADRDPQRWTRPDHLRLSRQPNRVLAFGHGPHYCLGAHLARLEAAIVLETIARRLPDLTLAEETATPHGGTFHGPTSLIVHPHGQPSI